MRRARRNEDFGGCTPDDDDALEVVLHFELANVLAELLGEVALGLAGLDVRPRDPRDVVVVEHRRHRLDGREEVSHPIEIRRLEHSRLAGRRQRIIGHGVPRAEDEVVEASQRDEF